MKAITVHSFGGPENMLVEEIQTPEPSAGEVLVKVFATSLNPVDFKVIAGERQHEFPVKLPFTPGNDVSGVIEKIGPEVQDFSAGDAVYGRADPTKNGTFAEYIVISANRISRKPISIDHIEAASVPLAGLTAWQCLFMHGKLQSDQKVLIHGGAGSVGAFAVQFAREKGSYVIATAGTNDITFVKQLGANEVIDYKNQAFDEMCNGIDLVMDLIGGETQRRSVSVLKIGGILISTQKIEFEAEAKNKDIYIAHFSTTSEPEDLQKIATLIDESKVKCTIKAVFSLEQVQEAVKSNKSKEGRGKIILQVV